MRAQIEVTGLTPGQFEVLDQILKTAYQFPDEGSTRLCVVFQIEGNCCSTDGERHVEMPASAFDQALYLLEGVARGGVIHRHGDLICAVQPSPALVETSSGGPE